jgi:hypothetical protein
VDYKTNSDGCKRVGLDFGRSVLVPMDNTGIPVTCNIAAKPNLTAHQAIDDKRGFKLEDTMGIAVRRPLTSFTRTPLRTSYLHQYNKKEPLWHLCNEPFDYTRVSEKKLSIPAKPTTRVLNQHYPSVNNPQLAIEFSIPEGGWVLVEILDQSDNNLEVISNAICDAGYHMAGWNTAKYASGRYKYRLRYNDYNEVHDLVLNKA